LVLRQVTPPTGEGWEVESHVSQPGELHLLAYRPTGRAASGSEAILATIEFQVLNPQGESPLALEQGKLADEGSTALSVAWPGQPLSDALPRPSPGEWAVVLRALAGPSRAEGCFGVSRDADQQAVALLPPARFAPGPRVELSFVPRAGKETARSADIQPTSPGPTAWELVVTSNVIGADVVLTWGNLRQVPSEARLTLVDLKTGERRDLRTRSGYIYRAEVGPRTADVRRFRLELNPSPAGKLILTNVAVSPPRGRGGAGTLSFTLNQPAEVSGEIATLSGRAIVSLPAVPGGTGLNTRTWLGQDADGRPLPAGVFLLRLTARTEEGDLVQATRAVRWP
jgi:hypothetical protein